MPYKAAHKGLIMLRWESGFLGELLSSSAGPYRRALLVR